MNRKLRLPNLRRFTELTAINGPILPLIRHNI